MPASGRITMCSPTPPVARRRRPTSNFGAGRTTHMRRPSSSSRRASTWWKSQPLDSRLPKRRRLLVTYPAMISEPSGSGSNANSRGDLSVRRRDRASCRTLCGFHTSHRTQRGPRAPGDPNITAIYGFEDSEGIQALVLELCEGPTLADAGGQHTARRSASVMPSRPRAVCGRG